MKRKPKPKLDDKVEPTRDAYMQWLHELVIEIEQSRPAIEATLAGEEGCPF
jgi:hypothetical protein